MRSVHPALFGWVAGYGWLIPVPESAMLCGEPLALSTMVNAAVAEPVTVGAKTKLTVQDVLGANDPTQVLHLTNAAGLAPVSVPLKVNVEVPLLVRVTVCVALIVLIC